MRTSFRPPHLCVHGSPFASVFPIFTTRGGRGCRVSILFRYTFVHIDMLESMLATRTACSLYPLPLLGELLGASWLAPIWQARPSLVRSMMRTFFFYFFHIYFSTKCSLGYRLPCRSQSHLGFWLRSSVVSVLIGLIFFRLHQLVGGGWRGW